MPLNARLVVVGGEVKTAEIKLRLPTTIGRGRGSTIMLPHPLVSRQHCEIFETDGRLMVRDLGSLNGTFINNERISEAALPAGELLTVGAVTFRAVYEVQEGSSPPLGEGPKLKSKARDTDNNGTLPFPDKPPEAKQAAPPRAPVLPPEEDDDEVEFNFDEPLTPVDEMARVGAKTTTGTKTEPTVEALAKQAALAKTTPAPGKIAPPKPAAPAKPAAAAKPPSSEAAKPAAPAAAPDEKPVNFTAWELEDKVDPKGESDDDFGDFLKSLGEK